MSDVMIRPSRRILLQAGLQGLGAMMLGCGRDQRSRETPPLTGGSAGIAGNGGEPSFTATGGQAYVSEGGVGGEPAPVSVRAGIKNMSELGEANAAGLRLPQGYQGRILARSGEVVPGGGGYVWHSAPDGGAVFPHSDGGWIYVSNSELTGSGGVGALRFNKAGEIIGAYSIVEGTQRNCAGGATPWGTWLSCEEVANGRVIECDPRGKKPAKVLPLLGVNTHEALAFDLDKGDVYLSEDLPDGRFYRFTPADPESVGSARLESGRLYAAEITAKGKVKWHEVPDPAFLSGVPTRYQVPNSTAFLGGEGVWWENGVVYLSTKGDDRVWSYRVNSQRISVLYDARAALNPVLTGVDCLVGACCGELLVAEDNGDMQVVAILPDGSLKALVQVEGHAGSEITGLAFDPSGTRLYFSSQRGGGSGITYEMSGPFI